MPNNKLQQFLATVNDAHVHLWDLKNNLNQWVINSNQPRLKQNYLLQDYLNKFPKSQSILTIEAADNNKGLLEAQWLATEIINNPQQIVIKHIAGIDMLQANHLFEQELQSYAKYNFVIGFRHILSYNASARYNPCTSDFTEDESLLKNFASNLNSLAKSNYIFNAQMYPQQLLTIKNLIIHSNVVCVIDHAGLPIINNHKDYSLWLDMLEQFKDIAYFKFSGLDLNNDITDFALITSTLHQYIDQHKILPASNYPVSDY